MRYSVASAKSFWLILHEKRHNSQWKVRFGHLQSTNDAIDFSTFDVRTWENLYSKSLSNVDERWMIIVHVFPRKWKFQWHRKNVFQQSTSMFDRLNRTRDGHLVGFDASRITISIGKMNVRVRDWHDTLNLIALSSDTMSVISKRNFDFQCATIHCAEKCR